MSFKIIVSDLDGTLLKTDKTISDYTYQILKKARDLGIFIVLASGRSRLAIPEKIRNLEFVTHIISCNGSNVYDAINNKVIYRNEIANETALAILNKTKQYNVVEDCSFSDSAYVERYKFEHIEDYLDDEMLLFSLKTTRKPYDNLYSVKEDFQKLEYLIPNDTLRKRLMNEIAGEYKDEVDVVTSYKINFEVGPKNSNKGAALKYLCSYLNISKDEIICFGDNLNDIEMLSYAGIKAVPINGEKKVKDIADYVIDTCDNDGVAKLIDKLLNKKA